MTGTAKPALRRWIHVAVAVLVLAFLIPAIAARWDDFRAIRISIHPDPGWLALSVAIVLLTYLVQIESWRRVLIGWGQPLPFRPAARAWCLSNLARYVPGKIWSIAGLVVLVQRAGVEAWAATASAIVAQALGLATGIAAVAFAVPTTGHGLILALGFLAAIALLLAMGSARLMRLAGRWVPGELRPLPLATILQAGGLMFVAWVGYGLSFWALARGLGIPGLDTARAVGTFAGGYIVGWLLIVPAGVGTRELTLVGLLTPLVGAGGAVTLSLASRVVLTVTELVAAALSAPGGRRPSR